MSQSTHTTMVTITTMIMTTPDRDQRQRAQGPAVLFLIFGFMVVEAVGGVLSGLLALLADAGHMLTDAAALALAYAAFLVRPPRGRQQAHLRLPAPRSSPVSNAVTLFAIVA